MSINETNLLELTDHDEPIIDLVEFDFANVEITPTRRQFVQVLGAGILIAVGAPSIAVAQNPNRSGRGGRGGFGGGGRTTVAARLHIGKDGTITLLTGKVECGQGARAEMTQAAAEELRVAAERIVVIMADTALVPNDGITAGSGSTPRTVPAIRQAAAFARKLLVDLASDRWSVKPDDLEVRDGRVIHPPTKREQSYADLASADDATKKFDQTVPSDVTVTPVNEWKVLGTFLPRANRSDIVTGKHRYPSDIARKGMLHGKILRPAGYGAKLKSIDVAEVKAMPGVTLVQDGDFVGVAAPTTFAAGQALEALASAAKWDSPPQPSSAELFDYLKKHVRGGESALKNPFEGDLAKAAKALRAEYRVAYIQHAPMEPRAAVAEWDDGKLTVWTGSQNPFGVRSELARAFNLGEDKVRVIVPDFGGGFGGKHSGEMAVEAARLAKSAGRPVSLRWTREEEFTWASFRPAGLLLAEAGLDSAGKITSWHFLNINSGPSAVETPYRIAQARSQFVPSDPLLRQSSYRALASTANVFARECFMDELAAAAGLDPLEFRLAHLDNPRLRAVLEDAAKRFGWPSAGSRAIVGRAAADPRSPSTGEGGSAASLSNGREGEEAPKVTGALTGTGLACGTEKGSFAAACVEVSIDRERNRIAVTRVSQVFECGKIINPGNLLSQVQGAIIMGFGAALREEIRFENGKITNAAFSKYRVPRMDDVPEFDIHLLDRPDLPSAGAGETPIVAIAPAIANAVSRATGKRVREMPMRLGT
jgi:isoquinoline 1-oxidoreductase